MQKLKAIKYLIIFFLFVFFQNTYSLDFTKNGCGRFFDGRTYIPLNPEVFPSEYGFGPELLLYKLKDISNEVRSMSNNTKGNQLMAEEALSSILILTTFAKQKTLITDFVTQEMLWVLYSNYLYLQVYAPLAISPISKLQPQTKKLIEQGLVELNTTIKATKFFDRAEAAGYSLK